VPGGEAGREAHDAFLPAFSELADAGRCPAFGRGDDRVRVDPRHRVPSLMRAAVSTWRVKSSRCRNDFVRGV
jgi:hypothetical protein